MLTGSLADTEARPSFPVLSCPPPPQPATTVCRGWAWGCVDVPRPGVFPTQPSTRGQRFCGGTFPRYLVRFHTPESQRRRWGVRSPMLLAGGRRAGIYRAFIARAGPFADVHRVRAPLSFRTRTVVQCPERRLALFASRGSAVRVRSSPLGPVRRGERSTFPADVAVVVDPEMTAQLERLFSPEVNRTA